MKSKKILNLLLIAVICVGAASCDIFNERDRTYNGPPKVALFPQNSVTAADTVATGSTINLQVQRISRDRSQPVTVNFSVDDSTTAVEGQDFAVGASSPVTIPADSSIAVIPVQVSSENVTPNGVATIYLSIDASGDYTPAANLKTSQITIRGVVQ